MFHPTPRNALFVGIPQFLPHLTRTIILCHNISATKRATGDPLVSKRPDFRGLFGFSKKMTFSISGFLDFWISGFVLDFWQFFLDLLTNFFGFIDEIFWICQRIFLDLSTKFFGFVEKKIGICRRK